MVGCFRESSCRAGAFECRCDLRHAHGEWNLDVRGVGEGQRIACADGIDE
jgi:hypothetical protein